MTRTRLFAALALGLVGILAAGILMVATPAFAQSLTLNLGEEGGQATGRIIQMVVLVTVLSLAPRSW